MKLRLLLSVPIVLLIILIVNKSVSVQASSSEDCSAFSSGFVIPANGFEIDFSCSEAQKVYFGVCDSGFVADDFYSLTFQNEIVSSNYYNSSGQGVTIDEQTAEAGINTVNFNVLQSDDDAATFSYAISPTRGDVADYISGYLW